MRTLSSPRRRAPEKPWGRAGRSGALLADACPCTNKRRRARSRRRQAARHPLSFSCLLLIFPCSGAPVAQASPVRHWRGFIRALFFVIASGLHDFGNRAVRGPEFERPFALG